MGLDLQDNLWKANIFSIALNSEKGPSYPISFEISVIFPVQPASRQMRSWLLDNSFLLTGDFNGNFVLYSIDWINNDFKLQQVGETKLPLAEKILEFNSFEFNNYSHPWGVFSFSENSMCASGIGLTGFLGNFNETFFGFEIWNSGAFST